MIRRAPKELSEAYSAEQNNGLRNAYDSFPQGV